MLRLADRMDNMKGAATREILKLTAAPDIISFAGGMPGKDCFPVSEIRDIATELLSGPRAVNLLQYGTTDGLSGFREAIAEYAKEFGITGLKNENIIALSGGQQGLDLACKAFLQKGDVCLVERPTYLAMLQILNSYEANAVGVDACKDGLDLADLEEKIKKHNPKLLYVVPTFSNPTGGVYTEENRKRIAELAEKYGVIVVEDDPYSRLRYSGEPVKSILGLTGSKNVVFVSSFSKLVSPGLRVGFAAGDKEIIRKIEICKQGADVHTASLNQAICEEFLKRGILLSHIKKILPVYNEKKNRMVAAVRSYMPGIFEFSDVDGGLFLWGRLPGVDTHALFPKAAERKAAYVYGDVFFPDGSGKDTLRLNFSNATLPDIDEGMRRLGELFREEGIL